MYVYVFVCIIRVFVCIIYIYICMCMYVYVCAYIISMCMYVYVYACICMYHSYVYVCVQRPCNAPATPLQHPCMCMYMCMYVYVSFIYVLYEGCMCMYESVWVSMMCSVAPFDTIFPLRPIQIGCLDHDLSTALFPSQHTASRRKALSPVPSLSCFPITLLGLLAINMVTGCWNGPHTPSLRLTGFAIRR